ncbi:MAG: UDP-glucuronate 4-epimerase, partial [Candidatus Azotimanducaceae bacterium]
MTILVTGAAGFIGFHVSKALLGRGEQVFGIDNLNDYYDPNLKLARLAELEKFDGFEFRKLDVSDFEAVQEVFEEKQFTKVVHLAAQAGVRYSIENPMAYIQSNIVGFQSMLEACRLHGVEHLVYASSSSVYGNSDKVPFSTTDSVDHPVSTYAATKKSNELMAHVYSHLYKLPTTGLRFFTVYGPWGRPDMSPFLFANSIFEGKPIQVFNYGNHSRDFTFVDDISQGLIAVLDKPPHQGTSAEATPYKVY